MSPANARALAVESDAELYEEAPCGFLTTLPDGRIVRANRTLQQWLGYELAELQQRRFVDLLSLGGRVYHDLHIEPQLRLTGRVTDASFDLLRVCHTRQPVLLSAVRKDDADGQHLLTRITLFDATDRRRYERDLLDARHAAEAARREVELGHRDLQQRSRELLVTLAAIADAVVGVDMAQRITLCNPSAEALFGWREIDVLGAPLARACPLVDCHACPVLEKLVAEAIDAGGVAGLPAPARLARADAEGAAPASPMAAPTAPVEAGPAPVLVDARASLIRHDDGSHGGLVLTMRDVTAQSRAQEDLLRLVERDRLTGLLSRSEFERRVSILLECRESEPADHVLCYLDLDQFKLLNDTCGHLLGDELLCQIAAILAGCVREDDLLARMGGDEFAVLLPHCSLEAGLAIAERMRERVGAHRLHHAGGVFRGGTSIGVVPVPAGRTALSGLLADADLACYVAKEAGRNRVHVLHPDDTAVAQRKAEMHLLALLRQALEDDRLVLHLQSIVPVAAARRIGSDRPGGPGRRGREHHGEVLLRLRREDGSLLGPGEFIPAAERYGQIGAIDRWVIQAALGALRRTRDLTLSVNLSGPSVGSRGFLAEVHAALDAEPGLASRLCLEITESAAISNLDQALQFIAELRARGVRFALDDFGSGLSSLSYLKDLAVDYLKLDGVFIRGIDGDPVNAAIVGAVCGVARSMGIATVAECVEQLDTVGLLERLGVDHIQGYATGRPEDLAGYVAAHGLALSGGAETRS